MSQALLKVQDLQVHFDTDDGVLHAVDGVSFHIDRSETLGVVGESGCGKSVTAMTIMKLLAMPPGRIANGQIWFEGRDLVQADAQAMQKIRAREIAMVFQEPMTSLNPVLSVGEQIGESLRLHEGLSAQQAKARAIEMLGLVNIPKPEQRVHDYPHQFSGGMRQRVMIAMALSCNPKLLIADEPTTALDVTIQAQILDLLDRLKSQMGMSILLITHAMGVVAETCQRVVVMYAGRVVEEASVEDLFGSPAHPYTQGLIRSIPRLDLDSAHKQRLHAIPGSVPKLILPPPGCRFAPRCPHANARCASEMPELRELTPGHRVACHFAI
ncbi:MAG: dipeptide/oligopeptide/nickel ABC transporter ATP-binding protein [Comamonadaceae bacterium PBBC1]|nr:MAG: dipeptide/oligopeptide/nickel ABC transporter ATP-binding protein [Comamonadaceae bacterium PBBC1]